MVTYWKKIWWPNAFWESPQSFFNMFNSNTWHELCSAGIFTVSFNQNPKYKPHKNSRLRSWFAQRDDKVISSHIQSFLWKKVCFKLGISLMSEQWAQPLNTLLTFKSPFKVKEQAHLAFTSVLEFTGFGNTHVSLFLRVKPSFQLHAHFWANDEH